MEDMSSIYREEHGEVLIEMNVRSLSSFFSTFDPSPFFEKDIDPDAEEYIVDAAMEIGTRRALRLVMYLPPDEAAEERPEPLAEAIHKFFSYRHSAAIRDLRQVFQRGRWALSLGVCFLTACLVVRTLLGILVPDGPVLIYIMREGLLITGWVAMWRPLEIFLYDWWPVLRMINIYRRLSSIPVDIKPHPAD